MSNNKCYNAGKIGGLSPIVANRNFSVADNYILSRDMEPVNPMKVGLQYTAPYIFHMLKDLSLLLSCWYVCFQSNWKDSRGARIEHRVARLTRKKIIYII